MIQLLGLATAMVIAVVGAILAIPLARYAPDATVPATSNTTGVVLRQADLASTGRLILTWSDVRSIRGFALTGQVITGVFLHEDQVVSCGAALLEIDGQPIVALCGTRPLWRDVTGGMAGPDVGQVVALLREAGSLATANPDGGQLTSAIRSWQKKHRMAVTGRLRLVDVVWIGQALTPSTVSVHVGDPVAAGMQILSVGARLTAARFNGAPGENPDGARALNISGVPDLVPLEPSGSVTQLETLERLVIANSRPDAPLLSSVDVVVRLTTPITVAVVPATAIVPGTADTCVLAINEGKPNPIRVSVVDSEIDGVLVTGDLTAGQQIITSPGPSAAC